MTDRINTVAPSVNGKAPKTIARKDKTVTTTRKPRKSPRQAAAERAVSWAHRYTIGAVAISAALNAYASQLSADSLSGRIAGAALGASVPLAVWGLAKVTAWTYRTGRKWLACAPGAVACALLALSVTHCASAFAALTGTDALLSGCLAVGIDCGLVAAEAVGILLADTAESVNQ
jgi:hypothetical protein